MAGLRLVRVVHLHLPVRRPARLQPGPHRLDRRLGRQDLARHRLGHRLGRQDPGRRPGRADLHLPRRLGLGRRRQGRLRRLGRLYRRLGHRRQHRLGPDHRHPDQVRQHRLEQHCRARLGHRRLGRACGFLGIDG